MLFFTADICTISEQIENHSVFYFVKIPHKDFNSHDFFILDFQRSNTTI